MLRDIEDTPTYKRIVRDGLERGRKQDIKALVQRRFPSLLVFARTQTEPIADPDKLQEVLLEIATAPTINEAIQYLSELHS
jgi:hypothetical protein